MDSEVSAALEKLEGLLEVERHMIREGSFDGLDALAREKEAAMKIVLDNGAERGLHASRLTRIRDIAARNQGLIGAAIKGVLAAQSRLAMIQRASKSLNSYDQLGRARTIDSGSNRIERKA